MQNHTILHKAQKDKARVEMCDCIQGAKRQAHVELCDSTQDAKRQVHIKPCCHLVSRILHGAQKNKLVQNLAM
jgi:predicted hydrocarbon binding protein